MAGTTDAPRRKESFFKIPVSIVLLLALIGVPVYAATVKDGTDNKTVARIIDGLLGDKPGELTQQTLALGDKEKSTGCARPADDEIEAHFNDNAGALPVAPDFDADPGEICGNGKTYFCTSKPPKKPIPSGWTPPPRPGTDPSYQGPESGAPFKESPYAMPSPKVVLARPKIVELDDPTFAEELAHAIQRATGKVASIGPRAPANRFSQFGTRIRRVDPSMFAGDNDEVPARHLLRQGFDFVLINRTTPFVAPWIEERMSSILLRLRDAVSLAWFHPAVLGSGYALYRIAEPFTIPKPVKQRLTARIRALLTSGTPTDFDFSLPNDAVNDDRFRAIVSLRWRAEPGLKGRKLSKTIGGGKSIKEAVDAAAMAIKEHWANIAQKAEDDRSTSVVRVPRDIEAAIASMEIEVDLLYDMCTLTDRTPSNLVWYLELGLEGVSLRGRGRFHYLEPSYAVQMEQTSEVARPKFCA